MFSERKVNYFNDPFPSYNMLFVFLKPSHNICPSGSPCWLEFRLIMVVHHGGRQVWYKSVHENERIIMTKLIKLLSQKEHRFLSSSPIWLFLYHTHPSHLPHQTIACLTRLLTSEMAQPALVEV